MLVEHKTNCKPILVACLRQGLHTTLTYSDIVFVFVLFCFNKKNLQNLYINNIWKLVSLQIMNVYYNFIVGTVILGRKFGSKGKQLYKRKASETQSHN